ncbi:hypothetical protein [Nitrososphaera sp.]|uniref:hypothetical protein n=1 Tax=Nitrososphaera sp. TaxID=1971748 RepID=UPI00307DAAD9
MVETMRKPHSFRAPPARSLEAICSKCGAETTSVCELCGACHACHARTTPTTTTSMD